jgi:hypothetical protein
VAKLPDQHVNLKKRKMDLLKETHHRPATAQGTEHKAVLEYFNQKVSYASAYAYFVSFISFSFARSQRKFKTKTLIKKMTSKRTRNSEYLYEAMIFLRLVS